MMAQRCFLKAFHLVTNYFLERKTAVSLNFLGLKMVLFYPELLSCATSIGKLFYSFTYQTKNSEKIQATLLSALTLTTEHLALLVGLLELVQL